jgi:hypothetical protein
VTGRWQRRSTRSLTETEPVKQGVTIPSTLTRDSLMSKKVMLNECIHYDSQVMPFAYASNLSIDNINNEIVEIKKLFGK